MLFRSRAVVDWDQGTRGDPLFDFATLLSYWVHPDDPPAMHDMAQMPAVEARLCPRAEAVAAYARASGLPTLADDSGLEVAALDGAPGVYTRRYAGANATDVQNYEKLLAATVGVADRSARFVCTMALVDPIDGSERTFRGECRGSLTTAPRGTFGFGYDPIFEVDGRTMAERPPAEKDALSHRGRAAALVAAALRSELQP